MKFQRLKKRFGTAKKAYLSNRKEMELVLGSALAERFIEFRKNLTQKKNLKD